MTSKHSYSAHNSDINNKSDDVRTACKSNPRYDVKPYPESPGIILRKIGDRSQSLGKADYKNDKAKKYDGSAKRGPGRPGVMKEIEELIVRMATETGWGYLRIVGALSNLGDQLGVVLLKGV